MAKIMNEEELDVLRLKLAAQGWDVLTEREALCLQMVDNGFGCSSCR